MDLLRPFQPDDLPAIARVWREVGWIDDDERQLAALGWYVGAGCGIVAELEGQVEGLAIAAPADLRYLDTDLPAAAVTGVTVSRVARGGGVARRATAAILAEAARTGSAVALLGIFDQGYYDQLGFGTLGYDLRLRFDPLDLRVAPLARRPRRLGPDDWHALHGLRLARRRAHGAVRLLPPDTTRGATVLDGAGFGLGFGEGETLSHAIWFDRAEGEQGPYSVGWLAWQTREQLLELLAAVRSLADQVRTVVMTEPPGIQLQDLLDRPIRRLNTGGRGEHDRRIDACACFQARILDLPACLSALRLHGRTRRFGLRLTDPIEPLVPADSTWRGVGGEYTVTLGEQSSAEPGLMSGLPVVEAGVGAFTRLWLGVRRAAGLAATGGLTAPDELIDALDRNVILPVPQVDWAF